MKRIGVKITLLFISTTICMAILVCIITGLRSSNLIINEAKNGIGYLVQNQSVQLSAQMNIMKNAVNNLAMNSAVYLDRSKVQDTQYMDQVMIQVKKTIENTVKEMPDVKDAYVVFDPAETGSQKVYHTLIVKNDNNVFEDAGEILKRDQLDSSDETMSWYYDPIKQKMGVWSEPYEDQNLKKRLITYSVPIYLNDKIVGVAGMDIEFSVFEEIVNSIKIYKSGYAFLLSKDLNILIDPVLEPNTSFEGSLGEKGKKAIQLMKDQGTGVSEATIQNQLRYVAFSKLENGFIFAVTAPKGEILSGVTAMVYTLIIISIVITIIAIIIGGLCGKSIAKPINQLVNVMQLVENGDLTQSAKVKSKDEIGKLAHSFNNMLKGEREIIEEVYNTSADTKNNAGALAQTSEQMLSSYNDISVAMKEIAQSSNIQAESMSNIVMHMDSFSHDMTHVVNDIQEVEQETQKIETMAKESESHLKLLSEWIQEISNSFEEVKKNISVLSDDIMQVTSVIEIINGIAGQTNLLALNASIEAARAGEAGSGFAIVAQEIGKLAEQTRVSSESISESLNTISQTAQGTTSTTEAMNKQLAEKINTIENSLKSFNVIISAIEAILPRIQNVNEATLSINKKKESIMTNVESVTGVAEEISASTQEAAASIEEMTEASQKVSNTAQSLNSLSEKLYEDVKRFKV